MSALEGDFFDKDPISLAKDLLGKVLRSKYGEIWLSALIIETEAYYLEEKGSHSSLGFTEKRKALFMPPGTIYMYYAHGGDSLNISAHGAGNAVLVKSAIPYLAKDAPNNMLQMMQKLNPNKNSHVLRDPRKLCSGQTLLCKSLNLKVTDWDQRKFDLRRFYLDDVDYSPNKIIQTTRLGIPSGRDEHLPYRFIDYTYASLCSSNPLTKRKWQSGKDYFILQR